VGKSHATRIEGRAIEVRVRGNVGVGETSQVHALGPRKFGVHGVVSHELLFEPCGRRIDSWVRIVLVENGYVHAGWNRSGRGRIVDWACVLAKHRGCAEPGTRSEGLLLHAVGCDCADLSEHVLARVEDAGASAQNGFALAGDVPSEPNS